MNNFNNIYRIEMVPEVIEDPQNGVTLDTIHEDLKVLNQNLEALYYTFNSNSALENTGSYSYLKEQAYAVEQMEAQVAGLESTVNTMNTRDSQTSSDVHAIKGKVIEFPTSSGTSDADLSQINENLQYFKDEYDAEKSASLTIVDGSTTDASLYASANVEHATTNDLYSMTLSIRNCVLFFGLGLSAILVYKLIRGSLARVMGR